MMKEYLEVFTRHDNVRKPKVDEFEAFVSLTDEYILRL